MGIENLLVFHKKIKWSSMLIIFFVHMFSAIWSYNYAFPVKWQTILFCALVYLFSAIGIVVGVHRYWAHRAFKSTIKNWVRNHRLHHKVSDTELDPHDASRGLFYSHIGWLMMKKTSQQIEFGRKIDVSDLERDPLVMWHERNVLAVNLLMSIILPTLVNVLVVGEAWRCAAAWCCIRYLAVLHAQFCVNSITHKFGMRPFNKSIKPANNPLVSLVTCGEGAHNYHHTFPFDYKGADKVHYLHLSTAVIKLFEKIGWAYDLREATPDMIKSAVHKLG